MAHERPIAGAIPNAAQEEVVAFLSDPQSYPGVEQVERVETHGNLIFLAGGEAWKIKRAVRFAYMDFSTLEKRRAACMREVAVNRQFGSALYLGCVPITRSLSGKMSFGSDSDIVEWAVHMRRFRDSALLSTIARDTGISSELARALADVIMKAHAGARPAGPRSGTAPFRELATSIATALSEPEMACAEFAALADRISRQIDVSTALLDERAANGFVRRCHGDLHLANIVMWEGHPALYDAIEFDEGLATIDTLYDLAFLLMDLDHHGQRLAANVVLNRYLWRSGASLDLSGLVALPLFLSLRAAVRAMVTVDRAGQISGEARDRDLEAARAYLARAGGYLHPRPPQLIAIGGLSGSGKSTVAGALAPLLGRRPGAIHLRSDLERKRRAGVGEFERLPDSAYRPTARQRVYEVLNERARLVLGAGHCVIIDAVFAEQEARQKVEVLAREMGACFGGLWLEAQPEKLMQRVAGRHRDASDATSEVVARQLTTDRGPLTAEWTAIDAGGTLAQTEACARAALGATLVDCEAATP